MPGSLNDEESSRAKCTLHGVLLVNVQVVVKPLVVLDGDTLRQGCEVRIDEEPRSSGRTRSRPSYGQRSVRRAHD